MGGRSEKVRTQQLCRDLLRLMQGMTVDAMTAMQRVDNRYGLRIDWHEFAEALDELERRGEARRRAIRYDGMVSYTIGREE